MGSLNPEYEYEVWDNCFQSTILRSWKKLQIKTARINTGSRRNSSRSKFYDEFG